MYQGHHYNQVFLQDERLGTTPNSTGEKENKVGIIYPEQSQLWLISFSIHPNHLFTCQFGVKAAQAYSKSLNRR